MISVEKWAVKIAEEVSPVEADFAPLWVEAFIKGGKDRRELFQETNAQAAGFLPGDFLPILPTIFKALAITVPSLLSILTSENVGKFLEGVKNALTIGEIFGKSNGWFSVFSKRKPEDTAADEAVYKKLEAVYEKLNEVITKLDKEMQPLALEQHKCDTVKLTVLRLLLENPADATQFLNKLAEKK
jgi:hypothetical protein